MKDLSMNIQNESLKELQMLSEKISDLIEQKKFDEIEEIDDHRKKIIKSFYKNKNESLIFSLTDLISDNNKNILELEEKKKKLNTAFDRIKVYKNI